MLKQFRLTVELEVEVRESVDRGVRRRRMIEELVGRFLKDDEAVTRFYRMWLLDDLRCGEMGEAVSKLSVKESDVDILKPVIETCSPKARDHFRKALREEENRANGESYSDLEQFFGQCGFFAVKHVAFVLVDGDGAGA